MTKTCFGCGRENPDDAIYCNGCGRELSPKPRSSADGKQIVCSYCGSLNPPYAAFCSNCAKDLVQRPASSPPRLYTRYCGWCGAGVDPDARTCGRCGHDPAGPSAEHMMLEPRPMSQKPLVAGILMIGAGILELFSAFQLLTLDVSTAASEAGIPSDIASGIAGFLQVCGAMVVIFAVIVAAGGALTFRRKSFTIGIVAAIFGMLGIGPFYLGSLFSLVALILVAVSRDDFSD